MVNGFHMSTFFLCWFFSFFFSLRKKGKEELGNEGNYVVLNSVRRLVRFVTLVWNFLKKTWRTRLLASKLGQKSENYKRDWGGIY
jgi:ABC-type antimicrobial peptide transport system permease subunit